MSNTPKCYFIQRHCHQPIGLTPQFVIKCLRGVLMSLRRFNCVCFFFQICLKVLSLSRIRILKSRLLLPDPKWNISDPQYGNKHYRLCTLTYSYVHMLHSLQDLFLCWELDYFCDIVATGISTFRWTFFQFRSSFKKKIILFCNFLTLIIEEDNDLKIFVSGFRTQIH